MAKNPKRVAAGKRAWAKMKAAGTGLAKASKSSRKAGKMAKKGGGGRRGKQGIVSWVTSIIALLIGLFPVWRGFGRLASGWYDMDGFVGEMNQSYNVLAGDKERLKIAYGAMVGGIVFKIASAELAKRAQIRSVIPALHA